MKQRALGALGRSTSVPARAERRLSATSVVLMAFLMNLAIVAPAWANLIITPSFDTSITNSSNASSIKGTINQAISVFESTYINPINVSIEFQAITSGLGESQVVTAHPG